MAQYFTLLTAIGQAKLANAVALNRTVNWSQMAVGDGNGNPTTPNQNQTALVRERYRAGINQLSIDPTNANYIISELIVPTDVGGWTVYEVGIFDEDGDLVAIANFPATYKPLLAEGSGRDLVIRIIVQVTNSSVVTLRIDPAIVLASQAWVAANFVRKVSVAGGTTGQVLAKNSNTNEDFKWIDPTAAVSVNVNALREIQTLAAAQTVVTLAQRTTVGLAVYIEGARLLEGIDWTATNNTTVTLAQAYPAGSRIHVYQNDPFSTLADPTELLRGLPMVATQAEVDAGTNDGKMVTPKKLRFGFSMNLNSQAGHVSLPSWLGGLVFQWARLAFNTTDNTSGQYTSPLQSWPIEFPNNILCAQLTHVGATSSNTHAVFEQTTFDKKNFRLRTSFTTGNATWLVFAIGS